MRSKFHPLHLYQVQKRFTDKARVMRDLVIGWPQAVTEHCSLDSTMGITLRYYTVLYGSLCHMDRGPRIHRRESDASSDVFKIFLIIETTLKRWKIVFLFVFVI
jgi:hypothetical protein